MAGRALRDSKGRYAGSTKGWGRGRSMARGAARAVLGGPIKKKGSGTVFSRPAAVRRAIQRGASVGLPIAQVGLAARSPSTVAVAAGVAGHTTALTYRKARTGRL